MAKDSYWFKHDSTAGRGTRMRKMAFIYNHWGKGIYWDVIEILRDQSEYKFEKDDESLILLSDLIGCKDEAKFMNWFKDCVRLELFQVTDKYFFSQVLLENMGVWESKKNNGKQPKKKRNGSETEAKVKANKKHNIIEDNIIEYNIKDIKEKIIENNVSALESFFMQQRVESYDFGLKLLDEFLTLQSLNTKKGDGLDRDISEIRRHFGNWVKTLDEEKKKKPKLTEAQKRYNSMHSDNY